MVITKVFQIKNSNKLKQGLDYIEDKEKTKEFVENNLEEGNRELEKNFNYIIDKNKTDFSTYDNYNVEFLYDKDGNKEMVSCYGLTSVKFGYEEMMMTKMQAKEFLGDRQGGKVDVLAHHIIQSFSPDDNLTPEEVHEVGRRTVLELTGGEHEFIIATHLDKEHLHNHIIFNTTNNVTLKKFRWQKGTKKTLEHISDKHAGIFGAKIIDEKKQLTYEKYNKYKDTFRYKLTQRLKFLLKNSISIEDFLEKAQVLDVHIDFTGKEVKYKLLNSEQQRNIRDRTLAKNGYYSLENIIKLAEENKEYFKDNNLNCITKEEVKEKYAEYIEKKESDFEIKFKIEPWQVEKETQRGLYVEVELDINNTGIAFIPYRKIEKENTGYSVYVKRNDYFYFSNPKKAQENRYIKGTTLARKLSKENVEVAIYKNYHVGKIEKLIEEFNYLSSHNITEYDKFKEFQESFIKKVDDVEKELDRLDSKIAELNKLHIALSKKEAGTYKQKVVADEIFERLKISKSVDGKEVERLIKEIRIERDILHNEFDKLISDYKYTQKIERNIQVRKNNEKIEIEEKNDNKKI